MKTIWKYQIKVQHGPQILSMPVYFLTQAVLVSEQNGELHMWVEVDDDFKKRDVAIQVVGTGWQRPDPAIHLGSTQIEGFVWHVYAI